MPMPRWGKRGMHVAQETFAAPLAKILTFPKTVRR